MAPDSGRWVKEYSDGSGPEYEVIFDANEYEASASEPGVVEIHHVDSISIPVDMVDWFVERLLSARAAIVESQHNKTEQSDA